MSHEPKSSEMEFDLSYCLPLLAAHLGCLLVLVTGVSTTALVVCFTLYVVRMFGITAGFHRYFSHRSYKTSRVFQFVLALLGTAAAQKGPLWWAAHHRDHHAHSDTEHDVHSPGVHGWWWSHMGWLMSEKFSKASFRRIHDLTKYRELLLLDKFHYLVPVLLAALLFVFGEVLAAYAPSLETNGLQLLAWGFFVSTVLLYHATFAINSLAHILGSRRFETDDNSKNSFILAVLTLGEGWHNNHHRYPSSEKHGFVWWEFDPTHYALKFFSWFGLVWDLRGVPTTSTQRGIK